jgi:hypothetical protein
LGWCTGDLGQAARDERRLRVVAVAQTGRGARRDRDDVLQRAGDLAPDDIGVGVDAEAPAHEELLQHQCGVRVGACDDRGGGLALGDLPGEVRAGEHRDAVGAVAGQHVETHFSHPREGVPFDALGEADDRNVGCQCTRRVTQHRSVAVGRHRHHHHPCTRARFAQIGGGSQGMGQRYSGQVRDVLVQSRDLLDDRRIASPEHRRCVLAHDRADGGTPRSSADDGYRTVDVHAR